MPLPPAGLSVVVAESRSIGRLSECNAKAAWRRSFDSNDLEVDVRETGDGLLKLQEEEGSNPPGTDVPDSCSEALLKGDDRMTRLGEDGPRDAGDAAMLVDEALRCIRGDEAVFTAVGVVIVAVVAVIVGEEVIIEVVDMAETDTDVVVVVGDGVQS